MAADVPGPAPLIALEGIDGSGKSTAARRVADALRDDHPGLVLTREETDGPTGAWVRQSIAERMDPFATTFLFLADRAAHVPRLAAWRAGGRPVLCDRYMHSTFAYQSVTLEGVVDDPAALLRGLHAAWCPPPDHVLLLRADPATCVERTRMRGETTPYEKVAFLTRVQDAYLRLVEAEPGVFHVLDADQGEDAVAAEATEVVRGWLAADG